jgi:hypothetical protein
MNRYKNIIIILSLCILLTGFVKAEDLDDPNKQAVSIALTKYEVNDTNLELSWKITNNTDHDIWTCESLNASNNPKFEVFLDKDAKTLVIRRRFNLPLEDTVLEHASIGTFVRLQPGREKVDSLSLDVPVQPYIRYAGLYANSEFARRLALEIGFFDEDLPGTILSVVELAEKLNCDISQGSPVYDSDNKEIGNRFFRGTRIAIDFYSNRYKYLRNSVTSGGDEIFMPHGGYIGPLFDCEKALRIEIDNVLIPYSSRYPPLTSTKSEKAIDKPVKDHNKNKLDHEDGQDKRKVAKK